MRFEIFFLIIIFNYVYGLTCFDCGPLYLPSNQCTRNKDCPNGFCTYYNKTIQNRSNINFQCSSSAQLNAPGGSVFSTRNKCVEMRDGDTYYRLKICNDYDLCNSECNNGQKVQLNQIYLIVIFTAIVKPLF